MKNLIRLFRNMDWRDGATDFNMNSNTFVFDLMRNRFPAWRVKNIIPWTDGWVSTDAFGTSTSAIKEMYYGHYNIYCANGETIILHFYDSNGDSKDITYLGDAAASSQNFTFSGLIHGATIGVDCTIQFTGFKITAEVPELAVLPGFQIDFNYYGGSSLPTKRVFDNQFSLTPVSSVYSSSVSQIVLNDGDTEVQFTIDVKNHYTLLCDPADVTIALAEKLIGITPSAGTATLEVLGASAPLGLGLLRILCRLHTIGNNKEIYLHRDFGVRVQVNNVVGLTATAHNVRATTELEQTMPLAAGEISEGYLECFVFLTEYSCSVSGNNGSAGNVNVYWQDSAGTLLHSESVPVGAYTVSFPVDVVIPVNPGDIANTLTCNIGYDLP